MPDFTREDLESLTKERLLRLGKYYNLKLYFSWKKDKLIDVIMEHETPEEPETDSPASVRIRRIR